MQGEVADDRLDLDPGVAPRRSARRRRAASPRRRRPARTAASWPVVGERVEQRAGLVAACRCRARRGWSRRRRPRCRRRVATQDRALGLGRVVLGQAGDLVEEPRARVVVEPLRRQACAAATRGRGARPATSAAAAQSGGSSTDDGGPARRGLAAPPSAGAAVGEAHAGQRPPRAVREEVAVGRARVARRGERAAAAQHHLVGHELAVVLADRARRPGGSRGRGGRPRRSTPSSRRTSGAGRPVGGPAARGWKVSASARLPSERRVAGAVGARRRAPTRPRSAAACRPTRRRPRPRRS